MQWALCSAPWNLGTKAGEKEKEDLGNHAQLGIVSLGTQNICEHLWVVAKCGRLHKRLELREARVRLWFLQGILRIQLKMTPISGPPHTFFFLKTFNLQNSCLGLPSSVVTGMSHRVLL